MEESWRQAERRPHMSAYRDPYAGRLARPELTQEEIDAAVVLIHTCEVPSGD